MAKTKSTVSNFLKNGKKKLFALVALGVTATLGLASYLKSTTPEISPAVLGSPKLLIPEPETNTGREGNAWTILAICAASFALIAIRTYQRKNQKTAVESEMSFENDVAKLEASIKANELAKAENELARAELDAEIKKILNTAKNEANAAYANDLELLLNMKNPSGSIGNQVVTPFDKNQEIKIFNHYVDKAAKKIEEATRDAYQNKPVDGTILGHSIVQTDKEMIDTIKNPVYKEKAQHWFIKFVSQLWAKLKAWWQEFSQPVKKKESTTNSRLFQKAPPNFNKTLTIAAAVTDAKLDQPNELNHRPHH